MCKRECVVNTWGGCQRGQGGKFWASVVESDYAKKSCRDCEFLVSSCVLCVLSQIDPDRIFSSPRILFPLLFAILVGQRRLFHKLATWLEHSRSRRLQDGAFMAMLLDSYVVEVGQPWWPTEQEAAAAGNLKVKVAPKDTDAVCKSPFSEIDASIICNIVLQ